MMIDVGISTPACPQRSFLNTTFMCMQKKNQVRLVGFVAIYRYLKQQLSLKNRVKHGALSGYTAALPQPSFNSEVCLWLTMFSFFLVHTPATCKVICVSFYPRSGHSTAGQVSDLFTFSLFWNTARLILKVLLSLLRFGFLYEVICFMEKVLTFTVVYQIDWPSYWFYSGWILSRAEMVSRAAMKSFLLIEKLSLCVP